MFRMWGKLIKDNHLLKDITACRSDYSQSRTQMVFDCLDEACYDFGRDHFIESVDFDYLEIQVIEE